MLTPALLLTATVLTAAPAPAAGVAPAFGNTIVSTYPDGRTAKAWLQSDGTYLGEGRRGGRTSGK
jgi:hypothetical protein